MVDTKCSHLQAEIDRLAAALHVPSIEVGAIRRDDDYNVFIDSDGRYHFAYWERGRPNLDLVGELDDVLYWFAETFSSIVASGYASRARGDGRDRRELWWAHQYQLLYRLDPVWAGRCVRELSEKLRGWGMPEAVQLLPDVPERG
ncbi:MULTISPECIES: Imm63 family immunity protein [unclassified Mycobacterium]|uniref:Imm63 family immunity protein n=1 Tax=unclassified Mycobacterium TaxID=2642494 RepID=UPI0008000ED2|nr:MULTISPECIES: Imm63 family immunity protein [unclassified Mycobacterium]OBG72323.1 hypothetical protein A5700_09655 [Mycobacterium sp. E1214]OBH26080.1 hypothetical protein A5693_04245 [Mycobacterium sp. E1319]